MVVPRRRMGRSGEGASRTDAGPPGAGTPAGGGIRRAVPGTTSEEFHYREAPMTTDQRDASAIRITATSARALLGRPTCPPA